MLYYSYTTSEQSWQPLYQLKFSTPETVSIQDSDTLLRLGALPSISLFELFASHYMLLPKGRGMTREQLKEVCSFLFPE